MSVACMELSDQGVSAGELFHPTVSNVFDIAGCFYQMSLTF